MNPHNDRHGELQDDAARRWLLSNREPSDMRNLASDIVKQRGIFEPPLVAKEGATSYLVYDGNRRVTCLKPIADPNAAPNQDLRRILCPVAQPVAGHISSTARVSNRERSRADYDEILFRRHTGSQTGIGQSHWDDTAKHNFIARTGRKSGNIAAGIEKKLVSMGYVVPEGDVPRSNLNRLLSSEELRNLVGVSFNDGELRFTAMYCQQGSCRS